MDIFAIGALVFFAFIAVMKTVYIVPQQNAYVVERLGRYHATLEAGIRFIFPFFDKVRYKHTLKEIVLDIEEQVCITRDNVQVGIDGVIFFRVVDPKSASYGITSFVPGIVQLAQTTLRSEIGKIDLDTTFEERTKINNAIVEAVDLATDAWGVKVLRYEIKSITPPRDVLEAMEKQMRAEREKRAQVLESQGDRDARINRADGQKQEVVKYSEAEKLKKINEAQGQAEAILAIASATAEGLKQIGDAIAGKGGHDAVQLRVAEEYIKEFGKLAKESNTLIIPASTSDLSGMIATAMSVFDKTKGKKQPDCV
ncbi:SPFH/Band 7/PHB domain protein [bacterium]|nr:SPFH/Band 7/PHB domain protein [bacterium]MBU1916750.1 SPFH/Band 7/PHB domain protein [bacterium]